MQVTYKSRCYSPDAVRARYVRREVATVSPRYSFCEVGDDRRYDIRQGTVEAAELPEAVRLAADKRAGFYPSYVPWPLEPQA